MSNINYPSWESGIPELMPIINPYNTTRIKNKAVFNVWVKFNFENKEKINFLHFCGENDLYYLRDAWSYTEILKWLREEHRLFIKININKTGTRYEYIIKYFQDDGFEDLYPIEDFSTYEEALDGAILFCLNNLI